jgi:NADPH-dependent 2,4-dienoyl-CoA reductase/sulfur reductase-like enzyme/nitrite reductase/ring-hydroxylating ferredoxin subunit
MSDKSDTDSSASDGAAPGPDLASGFAVADLPAGRMVAGSVGGKPVLLINDGGYLCAWSGSCTHMGAPLGEGILVDGEIRCPWHHARFSTSTGEAVGAPAFAPLTSFKTTVREGRVFVTEPTPEPARSSADTPTPEDAFVPETPPAIEPAKRAQPQSSKSAPRVVIVGAGAGGHACAELLGRSGFTGSVTLISDDPDPPYDRTECSKGYLTGTTSRTDSLLPPAAHAVYRRAKAEAINVAERWVRLDMQDRVPFDVLVLATGAEPNRAKVTGLDRENVYVLRTLQDADALMEAAARARRVVIIGASFIGLEAAAALKQRKLDVHVVAADEVPLEKLLGPEVGRMIRGVHQEKGIVFHLGVKPRSYDGTCLTLDDDSTLEADFVVLGIGVRPRTELAQAAGIDCAATEDGGGVLVNDHLETSAPGVFAIGDIARYPDAHVGERIRVEHWVHAQRQGQHVARGILGQGGAYRDLPFFWSAHFDTSLSYLGHVGEIVGSQVDGSIVGRDFAIAYTGQGREKAFVTCNRDIAALKIEAQWEDPAGGGT